jgi:hypothetical protein
MKSLKSARFRADLFRSVLVVACKRNAFMLTVH